MIIYSLWIKGALSNLNRLCIKSFQDMGHEMVIYSFDQSIDPGCEVRDAAELFPKEEVYLYTHFPDNFKFGGIAERLKAEMLYRFGGWHVDLDVVCLKQFAIPGEYVLRPHNTGVVGNIIKAPIGCELAKRYAEWTRTIDKENRDWERSFKGLTLAVEELGLQEYIADIKTFGRDEDQYYRPFLMNSGAIPDDDRYAIHFCGAMRYYEQYEQGSFYDSLLKKYSI